MEYYILFGPPGAGKGTQAALMADKYNFRHVSTGDLLRDEIRRGTALGKLADSLISRGNLVSDEIVEEMIRSEIDTHPEVSGFIFDGFPRTVSQAEVLERMLARRGSQVTAVLSIMISDEMVRERIHNRARFENRKDDTDDGIITNRIVTYHAKTEPLIAWYKSRGKYVEVAGDGEIQETFSNICKVLEQHIRNRR